MTHSNSAFHVAGGEPYLDTRAHTLAWWQLSLLDVYAVLALAAGTVFSLVVGVLWACWRCLSRRSWRKPKLA